MVKGKRPPTQGGADNGKEHPDLFDWAESIAAKLGATMEDVSRLASSTTPFVLFGLLTCWISSNEDSSLRPVLAGATVVAFLCTCLAIATSALRSRIQRKGVSIALQTAALAGCSIVVVFVIFLTWIFDAARIAHRNEAATKARAEQLAIQAAAKKREEAQIAAREAAQAAEEDCQKKRSEGIERTKKALRIARKARDECKAEYDQKLVKLSSEDVHCKSAQGQLDIARGQLGAAAAKMCSTGSIKGQ